MRASKHAAVRHECRICTLRLTSALRAGGLSTLKEAELDQDRWALGLLPMLALVAMLGGSPHAFGRTQAVAHRVSGLTAADLVRWMLDGMAMQSDIEASEAEAQQALISAILGGAPMGPLAANQVTSRRPQMRGAEIGSTIPTD